MASLAVVPVISIGKVLVATTTTVAVAGAGVYLAEHTKNKTKSNHDKHTKRRAGGSWDKKRKQPGWRKQKAGEKESCLIM